MWRGSAHRTACLTVGATHASPLHFLATGVQGARGFDGLSHQARFYLTKVIRRVTVPSSAVRR